MPSVFPTAPFPSLPKPALRHCSTTPLLLHRASAHPLAHHSFHTRMDKLKSKASSARNRVADRSSRGTGSASLSATHSTLPPQDNASTTAVNEGLLGPQPGTAARDFAALADQPTQQPIPPPPTSLASSVDAGQPVPVPPRRGSLSAGSTYVDSSLQRNNVTTHTCVIVLAKMRQDHNLRCRVADAATPPLRDHPPAHNQSAPSWDPASPASA